MSRALLAALPVSLGPQEMCMEGGSTPAPTWRLRFFFITLKWKWGSWICREPVSAPAQPEAGVLPCKAEPEHRCAYTAAARPAARPGSVAHPGVRHQERGLLMGGSGLGSLHVAWKAAPREIWPLLWVLTARRPQEQLLC